jgi:methionine-rich copper-binding protein CopC
MTMVSPTEARNATVSRDRMVSPWQSAVAAIIKSGCENVCPAFRPSSVSVTSSTGASIPASKPVNDPSDQQQVIVRLGRALGPGTYTVNWRALSVDTHTTTGTFHFTVS